MRALDAEEKRVLRLMAHLRRTGGYHHGDERDAAVVGRLLDRRCVKVREAAYDRARGEACLTQLGEIAARLP